MHALKIRLATLTLHHLSVVRQSVVVATRKIAQAAILNVLLRILPHSIDAISTTLLKEWAAIGQLNVSEGVDDGFDPRM